MKHDEDFLDDDASYATGAIAAEIDHKRYAREYGEHVAAPLLEQLAAKDLRIAELEKGLGKLWRIYSVWRAYGNQIYDYRRTPNDSMSEMADYAIEANLLSVVHHPLLKDQSSPLAEVAKKDADYL